VPSDSATNHNSGTAHLSGPAGRYATALYALADERHLLDGAAQTVTQLQSIIDRSPDFRRVLESPLIDVREAERAILAVMAAEDLGWLMRNLVGVLAANRRLALLPGIMAAFTALVAEKRGVVVAEVTTAYKLSDLERAQLAGRLAKAGFGSINLIEHVDPRILGGLIVKIGSRLYDTSLKSRLQRLQHAMKVA